MQTSPRSFDEAKLATMVEPLNVRVERIKGTTRSPIPLPATEGSDRPPGTEWSKDDVRTIEEWLVTKWSGGGLYEVTVTDSSVPTAIAMKWQPYWDPKSFPEFHPPTLTDAQAQPSPTPQPFSPQVRPMAAAFPNGLPNGNYPMALPQQAPTYYPQQPAYNMMPSPPPVGTPAWATWQAEADKRKLEEELRALRDAAAQRDREAQEAKHRAELERMRVENESKAASAQRTVDTQLAEMRSMLAGLASTIKDAATARPVGPDPAVEAIREQNRVLAAQVEDARRQAEADRRERDMRDLVARQAEESNRRFEELRRQHEQTIAQMQAQAIAAQAQANRPDAMLSLMTEQTRQHAETMKELARSNQTVIDRLQANAMNPRDILMLAKESAAGAEQATDRVTKFFGSVVEMQQKVTENALQMQPGGSGVVDVIRDGVSGIKEVAEKYVSARGTSERFAFQAQKDVAEAQARAVEAQANAEIVKANPGAFGPQQPVYAPPPPRQEAQLAGPRIEQAADANVKRLGRTDVQWFTAALMPEIEQLREGVDTFVEAFETDPPEQDESGKIPGLTPAQTAGLIVQATQLVMQQQVKIPAMLELLMQERYADFLDVVLPDAPQRYRDEATQELIALLAKLSGETPAPKPPITPRDPEDADEDDAEQEPAPVPVPPPAPTRKGANGKAARA